MNSTVKEYFNELRTDMDALLIQEDAGARTMINDGLLRDFDIDEVYGLHNWPGLETGVFAARVGTQMAAFDVFEITLHGQGAQAAMPHLGQDVLSATASLQMQLNLHAMPQKLV